MSKNLNLTKAVASVSFHIGNLSLWKVHLGCPGMCSGGDRRKRDGFIIRIQRKYYR